MLLRPPLRTAALTALLVTAAGSPAGSASGEVVDSVDVRLVTIRLWASDARGEPVRGLTADRFELRRDGEPIEIAALSEMVDPTGGPLGAAGDPVQLVLYLDSTFLEPGALVSVTPALERFLLDRLEPDDRVLVVEVDREVRLLPTAGSAVEAAAALSGYRPGPVPGRIGTEYRELLRDMQRALGGGGRQVPTVRGPLPDLLLDRILVLAEETRRELAVATQRLTWTVDVLAGLPGSVDLLYVGGRPPVGAARQLYSRWLGAFGPNSAYTDAGSAEGEGTGAGAGRGQESFSVGRGAFAALAAPAAGIDLEPLLAPVIERARAAGVRLHTLELGEGGAAAALDSADGTSLSGGGGAPGAPAPPSPGADLRGAELLRRLSGATQAVALSGAGGVEPALAQLGGVLRGGYRLAFAGSDAPPGTVHRLEVRLPGAGSAIRLRYPETYLSLSPDQQAATAALTAVKLGRGDNPLGVRIRAEPLAPREGRPRVEIHLEVPLSQLALAAERSSHAGRLSVFATAGSWDGVAAPVRKAVVPLRIDNRELLTSLGRLVEYSFPLPLPEGATRIAVGIRDDYALLTSTVVLELAAVSAEPRL